MSRRDSPMSWAVEPGGAWKGDFFSSFLIAVLYTSAFWTKENK